MDLILIFLCASAILLAPPWLLLMAAARILKGSATIDRIIAGYAVGGLAVLWVALVLFSWARILAKLNQLSNAGATKGELGEIRTAVFEYHKDSKGQYPSNLEALTVGGKYLKSIPKARPGAHHASNAVYYGTAANDAGGWIYDNVTGDPNQGVTWVNCTHTDSELTAWTNY